MKIKSLLLVSLPILLTAQACTLPGFPGLGGGATARGILKSIDNGEAWSAANNLTAESTFTASTVNLIVDPTNQSNLYLAGGESGLYASQNKAETWSQILGGALIAAVAVNDQNPQEILAGGSISSIAKLFRSTDQGRTWVEVYSESNPGSYISAVTFDPQSPSRIIISLSTGSVLESTNMGVSWSFLTNLEGRILQLTLIKESSGLGFALSITKGLYRTTNSGRTWNLISMGVTTEKSTAKFLGFSRTNHNNSLMYLATDAGLYRSLNAGGSWQRLRLPTHESEGRASSDRPMVSAVLVSFSDPNVIYATVGRIFYKSVDGGATWQTNTLPAVAFVRTIVQDKDEQNIIYTALGAPL